MKNETDSNEPPAVIAAEEGAARASHDGLARFAPDEPVTLLVRFEAAPDKAEPLAAVLGEQATAARRFSGPLAYDLIETKDAPGVFYLYEQWSTPAALERHWAADYTQRTFAALPALLAHDMNDGMAFYREVPAADGLAHNAKSEATGSEVTLLVHFRVRPGEVSRFKKRFVVQGGVSRLEPGALLFALHQSTADPQEFVLYEKWRDQAAFDSHLNEHYTRELFAFFQGALENPVQQGLKYVRDLLPRPHEQYRK